MKILFIFKRPVESLVRDIKNKKKPYDSVYGMLNISKNYKILYKDSIFYKNKFLQVIQTPLTSLSIYYTNIGFSLIPVLSLIRYIRKSDLVFTTLDTVGLPLLLLKYLKIIDKPIVYGTIGLEHNLQIKHSKIVKFLYSKLLKRANHIVSVSSFDECKRLSNYLNIPLNKFIFCPFGVDQKYFQPTKIKEEDFILSIGADKQRDWKTLINSAKYFKLPLVIVSAKGALDNYKVNKKITVYEDLPIENLRELMAKAKVIVIVLKQTSYFTGQTTFFQAMSMAKPVVITRIYPFVDYPDILDSVNCMLCKPGDKKLLIEKTNFLIAKDSLRKSISRNARKLILSKYTVGKYADRLLNIFEKFNIPDLNSKYEL